MHAIGHNNVLPDVNISLIVDFFRDLCFLDLSKKIRLSRCMFERGARACIHAWKDPKEPVREECGIEPGRATMQGLGEFPFLRQVVMDRKEIFFMPDSHGSHECFGPAG